MNPNLSSLLDSPRYNKPSEWERDEPHRLTAEKVFESIRIRYQLLNHQLGGDEYLLVFTTVGIEKFIVQHIHYENPNFIILYCVDAKNNLVTILVSHTNVQLAFQVVKKEEPKAEKPLLGFTPPPKKNTYSI